jgi:hypothetical protein
MSTDYQFKPHRTLPIVDISLDDVAQSFDSYKKIDIEARKKHFTAQSVIKYDITHPLYSIIEDGPIIFSLIRFITELEKETGYVHQFDFLHFFSLFDDKDKKHVISVPLLAEEDYIRFFDCCGQLGFAILWSWKRIVIEGEEQDKICSKFHLFHIIQNRETLTYFIQLVVCMNNSIKTDYAVQYADKKTVLGQEQQKRGIFNYFLSLNDFPPSDSTVTERKEDNEMSLLHGSIRQQWFDFNKSAVKKYGYTDNDLFTFQRKRLRVKKWCAQAANLNTTSESIIKPPPLPIRIKQEEGPPIFFIQQDEDEKEEKKVKVELTAQQEQEEFDLNTRDLAKNNPLIKIGHAYQEILALLKDNTLDKAISDTEQYYINKASLKVQVLFVELVAIQSNFNRIQSNKTNIPGHIRNKLIITFNRNLQFIIQQRWKGYS